MKIFISADMDGVAGVAVPRQCDMDNPDYERAQVLMTNEVNAAIVGAFDAGASAVLVNDSHSQQINLLPDRMDPRAELILGRPKQAGMFCGLEAGYAGVMCIGYHAGASRHGVLAHTIDGAVYAAIRVNGIDCAEATLYGGYVGSLGVPVLLLAGDDQLQEQCEPQFPGVRCVVVKQAMGNRAARSLSPDVWVRPHPRCRRRRRTQPRVNQAVRDPGALPAGARPDERGDGRSRDEHPNGCAAGAAQRRAPGRQHGRRYRLGGRSQRNVGSTQVKKKERASS